MASPTEPAHDSRVVEDSPKTLLASALALDDAGAGRTKVREMDRSEAPLRRRLVETAARLLAEEGPPGLTARRLADEAGTSTMAIYTRFGGMPRLRVEVRKEAFARLAAHLAEVAPSDDPVRDLLAQGFAYSVNAVRNPHLYRAAFFEAAISDEDATAGLAAFRFLLDTVDRCVEAERFNVDDLWLGAAQIWTATHGAVSLYLVGVVELAPMIRVLAAHGEGLCVSLGDERHLAQQSLARAWRSRPAQMLIELLPSGESQASITAL